MLIIRLRRTGKKHEPSYRIVVTDPKKSVYSPYVEMIGHYNPKTKETVLDKEKATEWMNKGAKPTNTVSKIFKKEGLEHKHIIIKQFKAISKKELEKEKAAEEVEKEKEQTEKEAAKVAFEKQVEAEKAAQPSSEEKLQAAANESIAEIKEEESADAKAVADTLRQEEEKTEEAKPEPKEDDKEESKK